MRSLETDRLLIRRFKPDDLEDVYAVFGRPSDDEAQVSLREWMHFSIDRAEHLARLMQPPFGDLAMVLRSEAQVIGVCGLVPSFGPFSRSASFGGVPEESDRNSLQMGLYYHVHPDQRQRRYATEAARALVDFAFRDMNIHQIMATTTYDNTASIGVMKQLGMTIEHNPHPEPEWFQVVGCLKAPEK